MSWKDRSKNRPREALLIQCYIGCLPSSNFLCLPSFVLFLRTRSHNLCTIWLLYVSVRNLIHSKPSTILSFLLESYQRISSKQTVNTHTVSHTKSIGHDITHTSWISRLHPEITNTPKSSTRIVLHLSFVVYILRDQTISFHSNTSLPYNTEGKFTTPLKHREF